MIIFLSDLHFSDETGGPKNIPARALRGALRAISRMARKAEAKTVKVVYLGDVFELIRSAAWQDVPVSDRPWGDAALNWPFDGDQNCLFPNSQEAALNRLMAVLKKNSEMFELLSGDWREFRFPCPVQRVFVPGNHDRLVNLYPVLRSKACEALGALSPMGPLPVTFQDEEHAVYARHGHEWDLFNFEPRGTGGERRYDYEDYMGAPIGDVFAGEFASALPNLVAGELSKVGTKNPLPDDTIQALVERLRDLFDVRPNAAMFAFLKFQVDQFDDPRIRKAVNKAVRERIVYMSELPYVQAWLSKHDGLDPFDRADLVGFGFWLLKQLEFSTVGRAVEAIARRSSPGTPSDNLLRFARKDFERLDAISPGLYQYVLYGHTHLPEVRAVSIIGQGPTQKPRCYLNTGRWRPMHNQGSDGGFVAWKELTYTVIFHRSERVEDSKVAGAVPHATFETWSGSLKDD